MTFLAAMEEIRALLVQGGWVMLPIFLVGFFAWTLLFERYFTYFKAKGRGNAGLIAAYEKSIEAHAALGEKAVDNGLEELRHAAEVDFSKAFPTIAVCATLAPMLGLLGTVSGMVHVFSTIQVFGFGNPVLIADGISEALLTTQAGLLVAFPIVLVNNHLVSKMERLKAKCWKSALEIKGKKFSPEGV